MKSDDGSRIRARLSSRKHTREHTPGKDIEVRSESAYETLREQIITLKLQPGAILSESALGVSLGISRTPVREALQRLAREYLVAVLPKRGIMVTEVDLESQWQLLEIRRGVEGRLIARGAERATMPQRDEIRRLAPLMETRADANDLAEYIRLDAEFDELIDAAANNRFLSDTMHPVHALVRRFWYTQAGTSGLLDVMRLHVKVIRAVAENDAEAVRQRLSTLYDFNERYIMKLLR